MSLTSILKVNCSTCGKLAVEKSRLKVGKTTIIKLACGHIQHYSSKELSEEAYNSIVFSDGCKPWKYQIDAMKFGAAANFKFIIADEQGLGKTIEVLGIAKLYPKEILPMVIVAPTTIKIQLHREVLRICGDGPEFLTQVIQSGKEKALPGFKIYIITYDMLKKDDVFEYIDDIQTIVIDECQRIKNHLSDRAKAVQKIAAKCKNIIPMSGTPIKNHAGEYFTVLNLVAPQKFPHYQGFLDRYCDFYETMYSAKIGGLKDPERFHEDTKDIIIRRTKAEVLPDLPEKTRKFFHVELDRKFNKAYAKALEELDDILYGDDSSSFESASNMLQVITKMRHITGISKVPQCIEYATEFLLSCDRKLVIFTHHTDVMELVKNNINGYLKDGNFEPALVLHSGLTSVQRSELAEKFQNGKSRILIASTLAAGEGINLQFCSDAVMHERQWNPANEVQAEDRFHRFGQINPVSITYMIASGTIDEYFTELVEQKRAIVTAAMDNKEIQWNEQSLMKELALVLSTRGREKWKL